MGVAAPLDCHACSMMKRARNHCQRRGLQSVARTAYCLLHWPQGKGPALMERDVAIGHADYLTPISRRPARLASSAQDSPFHLSHLDLETLSGPGSVCCTHSQISSIKEARILLNECHMKFDLNLKRKFISNLKSSLLINQPPHKDKCSTLDK